MNAQTVKYNIDACRTKLLDAAAQWGPVELCAVTKTVPAEWACWAYDAGVTRIGENRVQELVQKFPALNRGLKIDLIGQLQTNKVKYIMDCVTRVESLDRMALAQEIDRRAQMAARVMPCLVEVNIAGETQKGGIPEDMLIDFVRQAARLKGIKIEGLMAVMPLTGDPESVRPYFARMRRWFDRLRELAIDGASMECLSMGMSGDYLVAAQEGATLVRLGSAIFGQRA